VSQELPEKRSCLKKGATPEASEPGAALKKELRLKPGAALKKELRLKPVSQELP